MARVKNIKYLLKVALDKMQAYGEPKHVAQKENAKARRKAKKEGKSLREHEEINHMRNKIYSYSTMKTYQQQIRYFGDWLNERGLSKITLEQAKDWIQDYMDYLTMQGKSPFTVHTSLSACCKATGAVMRDYHVPQRRLCDIKKGRNSALHDLFNERRNGDLLAINRLLGLRRNEFANVRARDVQETECCTIIHTKGKGGKGNVQIFTSLSEREQIRMFCEGKNPDEYLFDRKRILKCDADFHSARAYRARTVYFRVLSEMQDNPQKREEYRKYIIQTLTENGKKPPYNLDKPYYCRGSFRAMLIQEGKAYQYDRIAALYVSVAVLNHWRVDVSIEHYIAR